MGNYVFPAVIIPLFICLFIIARFITVLLHELGHAIPALIFTKEKVTVFLGSYGDIKKSKHLPLNKRSSIYFKLNPLKWRGGMIQHGSNNLSVLKNLIILFTGPLFSLFIAIVALWLVFSFDLNGFLKLLSIIFLFSALFDLRNIYPNEKPILLINGSYTYNDGYQVREVFKFRKNSKILFSAYEFCDRKNYAGAIKLFRTLNPTFIDKNIFTFILTIYCNCKDYNGGKEFYKLILDQQNRQSPDSDNFSNIAIIESNLNNNELAMSFYNKSLELDGYNIYSLSNRGYTYNLFEKYDEAIKDFDKAIKIDPNFSYAFANRGYSKIKLNLFEEALADINKAITINNKDSYAFRNLGLYYLQNGNYKDAIKNLQIAFELDPATHMIDEYIEIAEEKSNMNINA